MKTTIEISDALLRQAKRTAAQFHTTVRALVEEGLRNVLAHRTGRVAFRLRDASVEGQGLHPDVEGLSWDEIRELARHGQGS